ncbi:MAG TPA: S8 family peptidase [Solirubrobacteraceae bacterium]
MPSIRRAAALGAAAAALLPAGAVAARHPNDPLLARQQHLRATHAAAAWQLATGGPVKVAVIDTGIDLRHRDLRGNLWTNPGEIAGNRRDDDGNGYVDDVHGYDFVDNDGEPRDESGHGTMVAGVLAARGNNARGISGVAQTAQIMSVRVLDARGAGSFATVAKGIRYAAANGARVANVSISPGATLDGMPEAIAYARSVGMLVVVIAGNDTLDLGVSRLYPACSTMVNVITVAATDMRGRYAWFSNRGSCVDVTAPGTRILSTQRGGGYRRENGTSFAAPQVAGAAVLALVRRPDLSVSQLAGALRVRSGRAARRRPVTRLNVSAVVRSVR